MVTLEGITSFADRVEASAAKREPIDWRRVLLALLSAVPYLLGKWAGYVAYGARIAAAAAREGYRESSAPARPRRPMVATAQSTVDG